MKLMELYQDKVCQNGVHDETAVDEKPDFRGKKRRRWDSNPRNNGFANRRLRPLGYAAGVFPPGPD